MIRILRYIFILAACLAAAPSCEKTQTTDTREFAIYYMGVNKVHPGEGAAVTPSYIGPAPTGFLIYAITRNGVAYYNPKLDGPIGAAYPFQVDPASGTFRLQNTSNLKDGTYVVSISCEAAGKKWEYPEAVTVIMLKAD